MPVDFTKVRMIQDEDYEDCRNHTCSKCGLKCNESMFEMNDELNKKYSDTISSDDRTEQSAEVLNSKVDHNNAEVAHELNTDGQDTVETHDEASSFINDSQRVSNNAERAISNPPDMNVPLNQVSNLNNVVAAENAPQVFPELTASAVNLTPPIPVIAQNDVPQVYNCTPDVATTSPGKPVLPTKANSKIQPYKCSFCPKTYSTPHGVKRHVKQKHPNSVVAQQPATSIVQQPAAPVVPQPTGQPIPEGQTYPKLIEINGSPV